VLQESIKNVNISSPNDPEYINYINMFCCDSNSKPTPPLKNNKKNPEIKRRTIFDSPVGIFHIPAT